MSLILRNSMITPDGTQLVSEHVHDFVSHRDANGHLYFVDGGLEYIRRSHNPKEVAPKDTSLFIGYSQHVLREDLTWGTYGKNPAKETEVEYVLVKDMSDDHIKAILDNGFGGKSYREMFRDELDWRKLHGVVVSGA